MSLVIIVTLIGFDEDKETQDDLGKMGIKIQMIILPILAFIVAYS